MACNRILCSIALGAGALLWGCSNASRPVQSADTEIEGAVKARLIANVETARTNVWKDGVWVNDGVVTLAGDVPDEGTRTECENEARSVAGVKRVVNQLSIDSHPDPIAGTADRYAAGAQ